MKVILPGATGMIGHGVLRECLLDPRRCARKRVPTRDPSHYGEPVWTYCEVARKITCIAGEAPEPHDSFTTYDVLS